MSEENQKIYILKKSSITEKICVFIFLVLVAQYFSQPLKAQEKELQLLDMQTREPVPGAHYIYGDQKGISNAEGYIQINYNPRWFLLLSHIEYGRKEYNPEKVEDALENGRLHLRSGEPTMLQPLTIRAMRKGGDKEDLLPLSDYDRLSHDAGSYLSRSPSIAVIRKSGNYGFDPVLRGFKYEQLNLVIDGVQTALAACPNRMDPPASQISLNQMENVEILKGPYFLRYGPATGGTINFISGDPHYSERFKPAGRISSSYESNGNILRTEAVAGFRDQRVSMNINGAWSRGGDYKDGEGITIPSRFNRTSLGTNIAYAPGDNQDIELNVTRNFARDVVFAALPMDLRNDDTWLVNAGYRIDFKGKHLNDWRTTMYFTHVSHLMDNLEKEMDPRMVNAVTDAYTVTYGGRTEVSLDYGLSNAFLGADLHIEKAEGTRTREMIMGPMAGNIYYDNVWQNGIINRTGLFAEYHIEQEPLDYIFATRLELNDARIADRAPEFSDVYEQIRSTQINPSLSAGLAAMINSSWRAKLWIGRGLRSGSLTERFINYFPVGLDPYELIGNPDLKPEINNQADIIIDFKKRSTNLQMNLFASYLQDFISSEIRPDLEPRLPMSPGVRQFINLEKALMTGFEINWQQYLPAHILFKMDVAYTYGKDLVNDIPLPEIPPLDLRLGLTGHFFDNKFRPDIIFRHVMDQDRINGSFGETRTPGFNLMNVKLTYDLSDKVHVSGGVENVFDVSYYEHLNRSVRSVAQRPIYSPGRSFYLTLTVDFMD